MTQPRNTPLFFTCSRAMSAEVQFERSSESQQPQPMAGMANALTRLLSTDLDQKKLVEPVSKRKRPAEGSSKQLRRLKKEKVLKDEETAVTKKLSDKGDVLKVCHVPPDSTQWDYEKRLQRIATRGVVQVFNAVHKQQQELESKLKEVGSSESKQSKVMQSVDKGSFLDMLRGGGSTSGINKKSTSSKPQVDEPSWSLLRDDFSLKAGMKEWAADNEMECDGTDSDD